MALTRLGLNQAINLATNTTGTLPVANGGTGLSSGFVNGVANPGKIGQVVSTARSNDTFTSSDSLVASGHIATLTPSATSSKILIILGMANAYINSGNKDMRVNFYSSIGGASYSNIISAGQVRDTVRTGFGGNHYLYSPNTTSAVAIQTYISRLHNGTGTVYYHNSYTDTFTNLTLMEVLA